jgi:hypothetical protein
MARPSTRFNHEELVGVKCIWNGSVLLTNHTVGSEGAGLAFDGWLFAGDQIGGKHGLPNPHTINIPPTTSPQRGNDVYSGPGGHPCRFHSMIRE